MRDVIVPGLWPSIDVVPASGATLGNVRDELIIASAGREVRLREALARLVDNCGLILIPIVQTSCYTQEMSSREQLTNAMAELLWERGYAATSPRDVMTRAGVGQGSMYHHFSGKHQLAVEALATITGDLTAASSALTGEGSPLARMKHYLSLPRPGTLGCRVGRMTQDPQVVADAELIAIVAAAFDTMLGRWEQAIAAAIDAGELPESIVPSDLARTLAAVLQGGYVLARAQGDQGPMDAAIRGALSLLDAASPTIPTES